ncbi:MAG: hypothetical protein ABH832_03195 [bacterium]
MVRSDINRSRFFHNENEQGLLELRGIGVQEKIEIVKKKFLKNIRCVKNRVDIHKTADGITLTRLEADLGEKSPILFEDKEGNLFFCEKPKSEKMKNETVVCFKDLSTIEFTTTWNNC